MSSFFKKIGNKFKNLFEEKDELYFSNDITINKFSEMMIKNLSSLKVIKELLEEDNLPNIEIKELENRAFNLLINQIELEKGNTKVEVGVIGSFSSGKSTFINSLFGEAICPMNVKPTTSSITKFYYGSKEKITINDKEITQDEYHNLAQHLKGETQNTKTNYIEYAYPFERLNSIILYDTPGFNNNLNENDTAITMRTLESVDIIFFVVDISKGALDKSSIERLSTLKDKRMYCILNKSDLKSKEAINKIKNEILSKKIFIEVIEYSSSKVLEFGEKDYFKNHIEHIKEDLIPKKIDFDTNIKGVIKETKSRLKTKIEYQLFIDENRFIIDDFYISAKKQRERIEKMFTRIAESKQSTFQQKLKLDRANYYQESLNIIKKELQNQGNRESISQLKKFEEDIEKFEYELIQFEENHISIFYKEWNYAFKTSCSIKNVEAIEKDFWSIPYAKIFFDKNKFKTKIEVMDTSKYIKELIVKWIKFFKESYNLELTIIDFDSGIYEEALVWYSTLYDSNSYISVNGDIYFEDRDEAREYLESFLDLESDKSIYSIYSFWEQNRESIEELKRVFYAQDSENNKSIEKLKQELKQFIKDKEEYVKSLQK